jgi:hypothetical protein
MFTTNYSLVSGMTIASHFLLHTLHLIVLNLIMFQKEVHHLLFLVVIVHLLLWCCSCNMDVLWPILF